jgi:poly(A) polymerase
MSFNALQRPQLRVTERLGRAFRQAERRLFLVGGPVRDLLLGREPPDLDFTTDAPPEVVKGLIQQAGATELFAVGERFGTIGGIFAGSPSARPVDVEITTYRSESYQPYSRKPQVEFGQSLEGDLARRDFTINAMALELVEPGAETTLIDPFGGQADLGRRLIRAVGRPAERFSEDPLRLLRAVRFATQLGFELDPETGAAVQKHSSELAWIPNERIQPELDRILLSPAAADGIRLLCDLDLMAVLIPELLAMRGMHEDAYRHKDVFEHTLQVVGAVPVELTLRWAALLHDIAKPRTRTIENGEVHFHRHELVGKQMSRKILSTLKYPRRLIDDVATLVELHLRPNAYEPDWTDGAVRRLMREAGENLERLLLLSRADVTSRRTDRRQAADRRVNALEARCAELQARADVARLTSPLDGLELMALFDRGPGPWIKPIKDHLTELVVEGTLSMDDKERAAEIARAMVGPAEAGERR